MKFILAFCVTVLTVSATLSKADTVTIPNMEPQFKAVAETISEVLKRVEEVSGAKIDFDKDKFMKYCNTAVKKLEEDVNKLIENVKNAKFLPDETKKKVEDVLKQSVELMKGLSSPEVQASFKKMQETTTTAAKKIIDAGAELMKSLGLPITPAIQNSVNDMISELQQASLKIQEKLHKMAEGMQDELKKKMKA